MNDRELLELAARAAGVKARWFRVNQWRQVGGHKMQTGQEDVFGTHHSKPWNPLTDDGDALRLAVEAGILDGNAFSVWLNYRNGAMAIEGLGAREATRLAFVRVAAEIGKSMGGGE